jgi:hypothetical protein
MWTDRISAARQCMDFPGAHDRIATGKRAAYPAKQFKKTFVGSQQFPEVPEY